MASDVALNAAVGSMMTAAGAGGAIHLFEDMVVNNGGLPVNIPAVLLTMGATTLYEGAIAAAVAGTTIIIGSGLAATVGAAFE